MYHLHVKNISRKGGRSVVAAAAYRAGETLPNEAEEGLSKFGGRRDVVHTEIILPAGAPAWMADRAKLWNACEAAEKRVDSRLAKEIEFAIVRDIPRAAWPAVVREVAQVFVAQGYIVDIAIHEDGLGENPHAHLLIPTRMVTESGFGSHKNREADKKAFIETARAAWCDIANAALADAGSPVRIDHRTLAAQGIERTPTTHRGVNRTERIAKRERAARHRENQMARGKYDFDRQAYREVLRNYNLPWRYPGFWGSDNEHWPPKYREMPEGLTEQQQQDHQNFWLDVDRVSRTLDVVHTPPEYRSEVDLREVEKDRELFERLDARRLAESSVDRHRAERVLEEENIRGLDRIRYDESRGALREWAELERKIENRMAMDSQIGWREVRDAMDGFYEKLLEIRMMEEENTRYRRVFAEWSRQQSLDGIDRVPVPDPQGNPISQRELDEAQNRYLADMHAPDERERDDNNWWRAERRKPPESEPRIEAREPSQERDDDDWWRRDRKPEETREEELEWDRDDERNRGR